MRSKVSSSATAPLPPASARAASSSGSPARDQDLADEGLPGPEPAVDRRASEPSSPGSPDVDPPPAQIARSAAARTSSRLAAAGDRAALA